MLKRKTKITLSPKLKLGVGRGTAKTKVFRIGGVICLGIAALLGANALHLFSNKTPDQVGSPVQPQILGASDSKTNEVIVPYVNYTVQEGDTLYNISQKVDTQWTILADLNKLKPPFNLKPGQIIKIPKK